MGSKPTIVERERERGQKQRWIEFFNSMPEVRSTNTHKNGNRPTERSTDVARGRRPHLVSRPDTCKSEILSHIYAKYQYKQESECDTVVIYIPTEKYKYIIIRESDTILQEYNISRGYKSTIYNKIYITKAEKCSRAARGVSKT